jgi:hypothetical protein
MKPSEHLKQERIDRMVYILSHPSLGIGSVVLEHRMETKRECVTDSGIILVKALETEFLITAYVATLDKVYALYRSEGHDHIPDGLAHRIVKNRPHVKLQNMSEEERKAFLKKSKKRG